jgi:two-component system, NtrC family, response regulator GlrR
MSGPGRIVGRSTQVQSLLALLERVAVTDTPLLIVGEPGTYKEAFADAVHQKSRRRDAPFLVVDCGGPDGEGLESELFGDERGETVGKDGIEKGAFEAASGGTVFLGEIGELSVDLQAKILRAIERGQIRRLGGVSSVPVDARIIASTSHGLRADLEKKQIRADFYYRLTTLQIRIPALRERLEDIPALVESIVEDLGLIGSADGAKLLAPDFLDKLARYPWPGNLRQLRHHVERCAALGDMTLQPSMDKFPPMSGSFRIAPPADSLRQFRVARKISE